MRLQVLRFFRYESTTIQRKIFISNKGNIDDSHGVAGGGGSYVAMLLCIIVEGALSDVVLDIINGGALGDVVYMKLMLHKKHLRCGRVLSNLLFG